MVTALKTILRLTYLADGTFFIFPNYFIVSNRFWRVANGPTHSQNEPATCVFL